LNRSGLPSLGSLKSFEFNIVIYRAWWKATYSRELRQQ